MTAGAAPATDPSGFVHEAGFSGHGFIHDVAAGEAMAELVAKGELSHTYLAPFHQAPFAP